ncbi:hypothetical protein HU200_020639 [Digitaria exilis]|uniref:Uncharacterized protein n=1 Tax=Digitaria exilis TaxID=1010633 RepID=A0A835F0S3_9POAL|nr:hypothetical protein HU200_020639 [Digitaria exilis]
MEAGRRNSARRGHAGIVLFASSAGSPVGVAGAPRPGGAGRRRGAQRAPRRAPRASTAPWWSPEERRRLHPVCFQLLLGGYQVSRAMSVSPSIAVWSLMAFFVVGGFYVLVVRQDLLYQQLDGVDRDAAAADATGDCKAFKMANRPDELVYQQLIILSLQRGLALLPRLVYVDHQQKKRVSSSSSTGLLRSGESSSSSGGDLLRSKAMGAGWGGDLLRSKAMDAGWGGDLLRSKAIEAEWKKNKKKE